MSGNQDKLNGSVDLLAQAMHRVYREEVEEETRVAATPEKHAAAVLQPPTVKFKDRVDP